MSEPPVRTPCVGMCSTTYGDLVCRGCRRFAHEIVDWNRYDDTQKRAVWQRLNHLRDQVVRGRIDVIDAQRLDEQLEKHRIPVDAGSSDASRAYQLLRRGARHIRDLEAYGLAVRTEFADLSVLEVRDLIDRDLQTLAEAHYERYFAPLTGVSGR
ncbi:MAG TPA: DUF1289 domain-containing protein [Pseudomonadales bacterium]|nr:DUF1289 domain-containing protein [Pseudomonadales bacterium]